MHPTDPTTHRTIKRKKEEEVLSPYVLPAKVVSYRDSSKKKSPLAVLR